jgi:hypothetical protein
MFETRLSKVGQGPITNSFYDKINDNEKEELLIRNTFINGLLRKKTEKEINLKKEESFNILKLKKVQWADKNNSHRKDLLCSVNFSKELSIHKDVKIITGRNKHHIPFKSILKTSKTLKNSHSNNNMVKSTSLRNITDILNSNQISMGSALMRNSSHLEDTNIIKNDKQHEITFRSDNKENNGILSNSKRNNIPKNDDNMSRVNNFISSQKPQVRSYSLDQSNDNKTNSTPNQKLYNNNEVTNIIITPKYQSIITNNVNNIYIQSPEDLNKLTKNESVVNNIHTGKYQIQEKRKEISLNNFLMSNNPVNNCNE